MSNFTYLTAPFAGSTKSNDSSPGGTLAGQLQSLINQKSSEGWEFYRIDTVRVYVKPGCLSALLGAKAVPVEYDIVVFRRATIPPATTSSLGGR